MPTRSPGRKRSTPGPARATSPTISWPGTSGNFGSGSSPSTTCRSVRHTAQALTFTRIWPAPGSGTGSSVKPQALARLVQDHRLHALSPLSTAARRGPAVAHARPRSCAHPPSHMATAARTSIEEWSQLTAGRTCLPLPVHRCPGWAAATRRGSDEPAERGGAERLRCCLAITRGGISSGREPLRGRSTCATMGDTELLRRRANAMVNRCGLAWARRHA